MANGYPAHDVAGHAGHAGWCRLCGSRFGLDANLDFRHHFGVDLYGSGINTGVFDFVVDRDLASISFDAVLGEAIGHVHWSNGSKDAILLTNFDKDNDFETRHLGCERFGIILSFGHLAGGLATFFLP